jgi:2,4-dienoyl-CoA reductase-like NADH-dependent reductase (Old Yellow Enzyme family)
MYPLFQSVNDHLLCKLSATNNTGTKRTFRVLEVSVNSAHAPLFEPLTFNAGDITLKNRLVLAPMTTCSSNADGTITPDEIEFLRRRSRGVGMAMTAPCFVIGHGHAFHGQWSCAGDEMIPSLRQAAEAIKGSGAVAVLQLHHGGRRSPASLLGHPPLSASAIAAERPGADLPREMTEGEIEQTIKAFGQAAKRAIRAGFDGVEIHGASGYLLQQFFSSHSNRRSDQWGGSVENRAAFPIAVLEEVQEIVRRNAYFPFSIGYRLSPEEIEEPGITMKDTLQLVEGLVACRIDWLHVVTPDYFGGSLSNPMDRRPRARMIAEKVGGRTKVIGTGAITSPDDALRLLDDGVSLVALGRGLVMDPDWVQKVLAGESDMIRECLPASGADELLTIPTPMYRRMLARPGWIPVCSEVPANGTCAKHRKVIA